MDTKILPSAALVVVFDNNGYILANTRRYDSNDWGIIGGKVEFGESAIDAAYREFCEETGVALEAPLQYVDTIKEETSGNYVAIFMVCDSTDRQNIISKFGNTVHSVESGILLGFVQYTKILVGTFGQFNEVLLNRLLSILDKGN